MHRSRATSVVWRLLPCFALILGLTIPQLGCVRYAYRTAKDSYTPPDVAWTGAQ